MRLRKNLTNALIYALLIALAVIWLILESPDLAVTEAAVGTGVTGVLFFFAFRRIGLIGTQGEKKK